MDSFEEADDIITSVDSWYPGFKTFFNDIYLEATLGNGDDHLRLAPICFDITFITMPGSGIPELVLPDAEFNFGTSLFLYSPGGSRWQPNFYLQDELQCGQPVSKILVLSLTSDVHHVLCIQDVKHEGPNFQWQF